MVIDWLVAQLYIVIEEGLVEDAGKQCPTIMGDVMIAYCLEERIYDI